MLENLRRLVSEMKYEVLLMEHGVDRVVMKLRIARMEAQIFEAEWKALRGGDGL